VDLALVGEGELATMGALAFLLVVWGIVFAESGLLVGFFLPGDTLLFAAGLLAADPRTGVPISLLAGGVVVAAVTGDAVGYYIGRRGGRPLLERREGKLLGTESLVRAERFYERYGWSAVVVARWIPWIRTFCPVLAGAARMPYPRFLSANVVGALVWGAGLTTLGWAAYSVPVIRDVAIVVGVSAVVLSIIPGVLRYRAVRRGRRLAAPPLTTGDPGPTARHPG
jgi:membrane-associated protein